MGRGIIVFGAPGSGQTTLGRELAKELGVHHLDLDNYHWRWDTEIPYTVLRSAEERITSLMNDLSKHPYFVMSGSMWSIRKSFEPMFDLAVFITVPDVIRAGRICNREHFQWGKRILPGGDMYIANKKYSKNYLDRVQEYEKGNPSMFQQHKQWMDELPCPVLCVDGTLPVQENIKLIKVQFSPALPLMQRQL
jgi:adenylate kinase family enzyme